MLGDGNRGCRGDGKAAFMIGGRASSVMCAILIDFVVKVITVTIDRKNQSYERISWTYRGFVNVIGAR